MPETPGHVVLDDEGVCNICKRRRELVSQRTDFASFDEEQRLNLLKKKVNRFRTEGPTTACAAFQGARTVS